VIVMSLGLIGQDPSAAIGAYRRHLDAGSHGQTVDFHLDVGPSMANAFGDHGMESIWEMLALAIGSGIADIIHEGIFVSPGDDVAQRVDDQIEEDLGVALDMAGHLVRKHLRDWLVAEAEASIRDDDPK
jgi:hypothetical protein